MPSPGYLAKDGPVRIPVYTSKNGAYINHTVSWTSKGKRQRKKFSDLAAAKAFADSLAADIARGRGSSHSLTVAEVSEYLEAKRLVGRDSLIEAAREYAARHLQLNLRTVSDAVAELLDHISTRKRRRPLNPNYLPNVRHRLESFAAHFSTHISALNGREIQAWLDTLPNVSLRTRNNYLSDIRSLVRFAILRKFVPPDFDALSTVHLERAGPGQIRPYTPEESETILRYAESHDPRWLPFLPVRMFTGIRDAEVSRLRPQHFHHATHFISCDSDITKTETRRLMPILPNLRAWLKKYPPRDQLCPLEKIRSNSSSLVKLIRKSGVEPRHNGLRDSYASFRFAMLADAGKVAEETGHNPAQLRRSYREISLPDGRVITPALARKYFGIVPKLSPKRTPR